MLKGNMAKVFAELSKRALDNQRYHEERAGPYAAELIGPTMRDGTVSPGAWHVLVVAPAHERIAASHLLARGFAFYLPELTKHYNAHGPRGAWSCARPMFPGYLFAYVWDVLAHWRRIRACPGVMRVLLDRHEQPAVVPWRLIHRMQAQEANDQFGRRDKRYRHGWRTQSRDDDGDQAISWNCYSAIDDIGRLDESGRIGALHRALGLA